MDRVGQHRPSAYRKVTHIIPSSVSASWGEGVETLDFIHAIFRIQVPPHLLEIITRPTVQRYKLVASGPHF